MIKEYDRQLSEADKKIIRKEIETTKAYFPRKRSSVLIKISILFGLFITIYIYQTLWLVIPISIVSFFIVWILIMDIKDLIQLPKFLNEKKAVIQSGIARVREIKIDRYIKIKSYNDEGDHYVIEYEGKLIMVGGQEFDGVRKLNTNIKYIDLLDSSKKRGYNTRIVKEGQSLKPYHTIKGKLPEKLIQSELWNNLTEQEPYEGKLEELDLYLKK